MSLWRFADLGLGVEHETLVQSIGHLHHQLFADPILQQLLGVNLQHRKHIVWTSDQQYWCWSEYLTNSTGAGLNTWSTVLVLVWTSDQQYWCQSEHLINRKIIIWTCYSTGKSLSGHLTNLVNLEHRKFFVWTSDQWYWCWSINSIGKSSSEHLVKITGSFSYTTLQDSADPPPKVQHSLRAIFCSLEGGCLIQRRRILVLVEHLISITGAGPSTAHENQHIFMNIWSSLWLLPICILFHCCSCFNLFHILSDVGPVLYYLRKRL